MKYFSPTAYKAVLLPFLCLSLWLFTTSQSVAQCDLTVDFTAPDTVCLGQTFDLIDGTTYTDLNCTNTGTGPAGWVYEWTITHPQITSRTLTQQDNLGVSLPLPITGEFTISLSVTNEEGNTFTATPFTLVVINAFATFSPSSACIDMPTTFRNASDAVTQWDWTIEDLSNNAIIFTSTDEEPTYTFTQLGDYSITLLVDCGISHTDTITVHAEPTIQITTPSTEICSGQTITLYATNDQGLEMNYEWRTALNGGILIATGDSLVQMPLNNTTYFLFGADQSGCLDTASIDIAVNASRIITLDNFDRDVCQGDTIELSVIDEGFDYSWTGDGLIDSLGPTARAVPGTDGTYTVQTVEACPGEASIFINVVHIPPPDIVNPYPVCAGDNMDVTVTDGNSVFWYNEAGDIIHAGLDFNPLIDTSFNFPPPSLDQAIMVFVTQSMNGCESIPLPVPIQILSNPAPPDVSFMAPPSICINDTNGLNLNSLITGDTGGTWRTNAPATLENGFLFKPNNNGSSGLFDLTYTIAIGSCISDSLTQTIEIVEPIPDFSATTTTICVGNNVRFVDQSSGADTYQWIFHNTTTNDSIESNDANPDLTFTQEGTYDVSLIINCGVTETKIAYITVTNPLTTTLMASADTVCTTGNVTLTATGGDTYTWQSDPSIISTTNNVIQAQPPSTTTYYVTIADLTNNCTIIDSMTIVVDEGPIVNTQLASACVGDLINTIDWVQIDNATTVTWSGGLGLFSDPNATHPTYTPATNETGMIALNISATNDCGTTNATLNLDISDGNMDNMDAGMDLESCQGQPIMLNAIANNATNIQWSGGVGTFSDPNALSTTYQPSNNETGVINFTITAEVGCNSTLVSDVVAVDIVPLGTAQLTPAEANLSVLEGGNVNLSVQGGGNYQWSPSTFLSCDDCPNPSATNITETTTYTITDPTGCAQSTTITVNVRQLPDETIMLPTAFSPNGDQQNDELKLVAQNVEYFQLRIFNRWGKLVFESTEMTDCWDGRIQQEHAEMGVYLYELVYKLMGEDKEEEVRTGHVTLLR